MNWTIVYPLERQNVMLRLRAAGFSVELHPDSDRDLSRGDVELQYLKVIVEHTQEHAMTHWLLANSDVNLRFVHD
jgi:hypothetical protein